MQVLEKYSTHRASVVTYSESAAIKRNRNECYCHLLIQPSPYYLATQMSPLDFLYYHSILKYSSASFFCFKEVQYTSLPTLQIGKDPRVNQILIQNTDLITHTKSFFSLWISHMMIDSVSKSLQTAFTYANVGSTVFHNPQNCQISKTFCDLVSYTWYCKL